jgi:Zn-dependent M28 family amino/carboxypeptidase
MVREHYNRLARMLERKLEVELELDVAATFHRDRGTAPNVIAELPGTDLADQVVMVGAHLDSWHAGTGATDNGGNCAVVMEAVRILTAAGLTPRRTIRIALWMGEEQGFLGSRDFVERHLATRPETTDPEQLALPKRMRETTWPLQPLPGHGKVSAYFNLDFGSGRIRGIFAEENAAVVPIFEAWTELVRDLGATTVSPKSVGGTDHVPFNRVGVPGFQFIQDRMDYMTRTHHTDVDTYDHLVRDDLVQASTVLATFLWHAANRDEPLPRRPLPQAPPEKTES